MSTYSGAPTGPFAVAVLAGGDSSERDVSLRSGTAVCRALEERGHETAFVDPAEVELRRFAFSDFDVAFLALHGRFGEDGEVQAILEHLGVPFTGSGSLSSRLAFSKSASKERFFQHGVPTPAYVLVHETDDAARIERQARKLGYPLVVKPDAQGSSLGVSLVASPEELPAALANSFHFDAFGVLEPAILGPEWTAGFLDDFALPLLQIEFGRPIFDYAAKYEDDATRYHFESRLPKVVLDAIGRAAANACRALETRGLVRVDLRLDELQQPWVLEVNTIPGLTDHSLVPKAAVRLGMSLGELCERAIRNCLSAERQSARDIRFHA